MSLITKITRLLPVLDTRSLSLFRILLGLILILDLIFFRIVNLEAFYTDTGILSRELATLLGNSEGYTALTPISPLFLSGSKYFVGFFFLLAGISYLAFTLGWKTKITNLTSLFFLISIQHRACIVVETDDRMLLCLLFWGLFLPLNHYFSIDNLKNKITNSTISKVASFALLFQVSMIYFFNGYPKTGDTWATGVAMKYAMMEDLWAIAGTSDWILQFDKLCYFITKFTVPFELLIALLILAPMQWAKIRMFVVFSILLFHWGISLFLSFGFLPLIATSWAVIMIPGSFWESVGWKAKVVAIKSKNFMVKWFSKGLIGITLLLCLWQSFTHIPWVMNVDSILPKSIGNTAFFNQSWVLYAPDANRTVGWIQIIGIKQDGSFIELRSRKPWTVDGSIIPYYQHECWQNFVQYLMYRQPYFIETAKSWTDWEVKKANQDGIKITQAGVIYYVHTILPDGTLSPTISQTMYSSYYN